MKWRQGRKSSNIDDRRGRRIRKGAKFGGGFALIMALLALFFGKDIGPLMNIITNSLTSGFNSTSTQQTSTNSQESNTAKEFVSVILADTEDVWSSIFRQQGARYQPPVLVLFNDAVNSACGVNSAQSGPFYCPGDRQVYLDLSFLNELQRLGADGDFAVAYVVSHEIGHHVQNLVGTAGKVRQAQGRSSKAQANALSVLTELQADCYAGVWAHHAHKQRGILEPGDIEEGINAAAAIGDDRLQKMAGRRAHPDSFTHGSSQQRMKWLKAGLQSGDIKSCDTFTQGADG